MDKQITISVELAKHIIDYTMNATLEGDALPEFVETLAERINDTISHATPEEIERARIEYAHGSDNDIEIDDNATASRSDDGALWVAAWVWLAPTDLEDTDDECRQTTCKWCGLDVEGFAPFNEQTEWRDRGNNIECPDKGEGVRYHEGVL